jgi:Ulp1 family protease
MIIEKGRQNYDRMIKKWGLNSAKIILLPLNFNGNHWVLIVVEVERKEILCLDSLNEV